MTVLLSLVYRSVRSVVDESGHRLNSYKYDPFGKVTQRDETVHNIFQYLGSLGVVKYDELTDMYYMRDRVYDATHGRFISVDPLGELRSALFNLPLKSLSTEQDLLGGAQISTHTPKILH